MAQSTAEPEVKKTNSKVSIEDLGPCSKKLKIEIPAASVGEQMSSSIDMLIHEAELPGFRKGRAPRRLVEKRFGSHIQKETKGALIQTALREAIEEHKLKVIGDPIGNEELAKIEVQEGKPLKFEVEVEVVPTFEMPKLDGLKVHRPTMEMSDDLLKKEIDRLLLNEGSLKEKEEVEPGDYLTGHAVMKNDDGEKVLDIVDAVIQVPKADSDGKGMILGVMVDDFAKQLGKPKVGKTITVHTTGPENHEQENIRGKKLTITFEPRRADEIVPAKLDDVAGRFGLENAEALKTAVKQRMEQRMQVEQQSLMRQQVARHLLDSTDMELPKRVTAGQAQRNLDRARFDLMHRGWDAQRIEEQMANLRSNTANQAVSELKLFFILEKAAEDFGVNVTEAELNQRIAQMAFSRGERPEKLRQEIIQRNQAGSLFLQIREQKTMDAILKKAQVEDIGVEEFNKLMGQKAEGRKGAAKSSAKHDDDEAPKKTAKSKKDDDDEPAKPAKKPAASKADKDDKPKAAAKKK